MFLLNSEYLLFQIPFAICEQFYLSIISKGYNLLRPNKGGVKMWNGVHVTNDGGAMLPNIFIGNPDRIMEEILQLLNERDLEDPQRQTMTQ